MRAALTLLHRYVGLALAAFLLVAGLTGALLAWYHELDAALNPTMLRTSPPAPGVQPLDPLVLREQVKTQFPGMRVNWVDLAPKPGEVLTFHLDPEPGSADGEARDDQVFVDPYTGAVLGSRKWGDITQGITNLMPFVYRLHYSLALGEIGTTVLGIVALLWTLDCFVGAYLTMPAKRRRDPNTARTASWWARWWPAWRIRRDSSPYKRNMDLHRTGGLWPWALLLVLGWSSVMFNLKEVYRPVMGTVLSYQQEVERLPIRAVPQPEPGLSWLAAREIGRTLMAREAEETGFQILAERGLSYDPAKAVFRYRVQSDRDVTERWGVTSIYFDANHGQRVAAAIPTGKAAGDTVDHWLAVLHMAAVGGVAYQVLITLVGVVVAVLSVTGVVIWWVKRRARQAARGVITAGAVASR